YCTQMLRQGRGFPLYIPGPSRLLPDEYQENGIQIGDIGTVTPEGLFDFLFNIYLPADHPININGVPHGFYPLQRYNDRTDIIVIDHEPGDYYNAGYPASIFCTVLTEISRVLTQLVTMAWTSRQVRGDFIFRCQPPEGAVLALPYGEMLKRLRNVQPVQEYARMHAESWYAYMKSTTGLANNSSLYLITGCEKATSWGLGSYHSIGDEQFQATFKSIESNDASLKYRWTSPSWCPARHKQYNQASPNNETSNQTVFIHGFSMSIRERTSGRLSIATTVDADLRDIVQSQLEKSTANSDVQPHGSLYCWLLSIFSGGAASSHTHHEKAEDVVLSDITGISSVCWCSETHDYKLIHPLDFSSWKANK
ncbi:hypothetical protein C8R45DRAFT_848119, partial [Mycena sanguinolenta]